MNKLKDLNNLTDSFYETIKKLGLRVSEPICVDGGSYIYILHDPGSGSMLVYAEDEPIRFKEVIFK